MVVGWWVSLEKGVVVIVCFIFVFWGGCVGKNGEMGVVGVGFEVMGYVGGVVVGVF